MIQRQDQPPQEPEAQVSPPADDSDTMMTHIEGKDNNCCWMIGSSYNCVDIEK